MLDVAKLSVNRLYSIDGVDLLISAEVNFSSATSLRLAELKGLPSSNTMRHVNSRTLQDLRVNQAKKG